MQDRELLERTFDEWSDGHQRRLGAQSNQERRDFNFSKVLSLLILAGTFVFVILSPRLDVLIIGMFVALIPYIFSRVQSANYTLELEKTSDYVIKKSIDSLTKD